MRHTTDKLLAFNKPNNSVEPYFQYTLLHDRQIRLLSLHPGSSPEPVTGTLRNVSLEEAAGYDGFEALSYTWGSPTFESSIYLNGSRVKTTANLTAALSQLRYLTKTRIVWIDAIWINQSNVEEKCMQVQLMPDIYAGACRVLVWLGSSSEHSGVGMEILEQFSSAEHFSENARWRTLPPRVVGFALSDFMQRAWFHRYWVVQEAALAKEIVMICGPHHLFWPNKCSHVVAFMRTVKLAVISPQWEQAGLSQIDMEALLELLQMQLHSGPQSQVWIRRGKGPDLLEFAYSMRHRQAGDRRDRMYSLAGLAAKAKTTHIMPDYSKTVEEVFDEFATIITNETYAVCTELSSVTWAGEKSTVLATHEVVIAPSLERNSMALAAFVENASVRVIDDIRNNNPRKAAQLLESTAMLLRGESF